MFIQREQYLQQLISQKDKDLVKVITGIRRSGKSVLLFHIYYDYLIQLGISKDHIITFNLEAKKNEALRNSDALYTAITSLIHDERRYYIFIDEIQFVDDFEDVINGLRVDYNCDIYITGSNSKLLSKDINTRMRGRAIEIKVYPLSFKEYYAFYGGDKQESFNQYLMYGGLPYLLSESNHQNIISYLKMMCELVMEKDIIERHNIRQSNLFDAFLNFLCSNIGSYISANKIANTLKSNGYSSVTPDTIGNYLEFVCDAYLFYKAQRYDIKGKQYLKTLNKYYICDLGMRNCKLNYRQIEITHSLENVVYLDLIRRGYIVDIGKNEDKEVDFIAKDDKNLFYIQVAYTLSDAKKKEQEISSFYGIDDGYKKIIITMDNDPFSLLENGYKKLNIFDFLLNDNSLEEI